LSEAFALKDTFLEVQELIIIDLIFYFNHILWTKRASYILPCAYIKVFNATFT